ncbi:MarR family transcriptional regulator [Patulibacter brassicae]|uniref:MarR family transcriptional regulator n=1 Tax=Patulibacter brassicae TaxID=1705717 RepID=A0ABU4VQU6_9ACTN|nr:MarR family transcriptional regulator [Patulibacter brassicae]MDX8153469.1 MarR family transcriptional regulator [Patulibacter brassicae]
MTATTDDQTPSATPRAPRLLDARELAAWRGMLRTHVLLSRELEAELLRDHGLQLSAYEVLMHLSDAPGGRLRLAELAELAILSRSGLTRLIDRLEREGHVIRERCESDARGFFAVLTAAGRSRVTAARADYLEAVRDRFLSLLSAEEQEQLGAIWTRVLAELGPGLVP